MATETMKISDIKVGKRFRSDMGDLKALAASIGEIGLLQPVGVTAGSELVFGERRLRACRDVLGWTEIPARTVNIERIVVGEYQENEVRKDFTPSERVAIAEAVRAGLGERRGGDTSSGAQSNPQNIAECKGTESRDIAAKKAWSSRAEGMTMTVMPSAGVFPRFGENRTLSQSVPMVGRDGIRWKFPHPTRPKAMLAGSD